MSVFVGGDRHYVILCVCCGHRADWIYFGARCVGNAVKHVDGKECIVRTPGD